MNLNLFYNQIKKLGIEPEVAVDCGAATGDWSANFRSIFPNSKILAIDANDWCNGHIPHSNITEIQVLSDIEEEEIVFYRKKEYEDRGTHNTGDSIFKEISQHYQKHNTIEVKTKTKTLSSIFKKHNINKVDILKIDTQGSELLILKGAKEYLKDIKFIELECSIIEYNQGGCKFSELVEFLKENFDLFDIINLHRITQSTFDISREIKSGDFLFQMDIIFKNKNIKI